MVTTEAQMQAMQEAEDIDTGVDTRSKKEMIDEQMSAFSSTAQTAAEMAPVVGDAIAVYNLPSDLRKAYELIQQGYTEGDIKDIGLGAGLAGLSALGVVPVLGTGAKIAKKGLRQTIDDALVQTEDLFRTASGMDGPDSMAMATTAPSRVTGNVADDALPDTSITKIIIGKSGKDHAEKEARYNAAKEQLTGGRRAQPDEAQELWNKTGAQEDLVHGDVVYEIPTVNAKFKNDEIANTVIRETDISKANEGKPDSERVFKFEAAPDAGITVKDIVDFPELFEQAPYLKNITVKEVPILSQIGGTNAAYDDVDNILYLSGGTKKELMSSMLHELEHAVQKADGFTYRGSNYRNFLGPDSGYDAGEHRRLKNAREQVAAEINGAARKYYGPEKFGQKKYMIIDIMKMLSDVYSPKLRNKFIDTVAEMDDRAADIRSADVADFKAALPEDVRNVGRSLSDMDYKFALRALKDLTKDPIRTPRKNTKSPLEMILDTVRAPDFQDLTRYDELKQQAIIKYMRDPGEVTARNVQFRFIASQADPSITRVAPRFTEDKSIEPGAGQSRTGRPETKSDEELRQEALSMGVDLTPGGTYLSSPDELARMKGRDVAEQTSEAIPVMPINQAGLEARGFDFKPGGEYVNPITKEILTGKKVGNANIKIVPGMEIRGGRPMAEFNVTDLDVPEVGSTGKGKTQILVNLIKPTKKGNKAGWAWDDVESEELEGVNTLVSVVHKGKHYFTLETDFSKGAELKTYPKSQSEPRLRPTAMGELDLQEQVGTIRMKDKTHPVYRKITAFASGGLAMAEGGAIPMDRQMDMFDDGGLMQEGGMMDAESGNDVPVGSLREEVRDDIPAQLSEGEFVFPADVVRYIGLEKLMQMRQEAKQGLQMMDRMGQMGNSEEAVIPDDIPFDLSDLDIEDDMEYNVGGFVPGTQQQQQFGISGFQQAAAPTTGVATQPVQAASSQFVQPPTFGVPQRPQQAAVPTMQQGATPFTTFIGPGVPQVDYEFGTFKNEAGQTIQLKIKKGSKGELLPGEVLPEGYKYVDPTATTTEEVTTTPTTVQTATVRPEDDSEPPVSREETAIQRARVAAAKKLGITDQVGFSLAGAFGKYGPEDVGKFTPTGFIIGKDGVLLDPLTGMAREESGPANILGAIVSAISKNEEPPEPAYSDSFFENMPDQAKDVFGRSLGKKARDARMTQQQRDIESFEKGMQETGLNRSALRGRILDLRKEEVKQAKDNIANIQDRARAELAANESPQETAVRTQRETEQISSGQYRDSEGNATTAQRAADDYTASRVSEAIATGDYSRGFAEGGLAGKPKPKAKKQMKRGGLASKK